MESPFEKKSAAQKLFYGKQMFACVCVQEDIKNLPLLVIGNQVIRLIYFLAKEAQQQKSG